MKKGNEKHTTTAKEAYYKNKNEAVILLERIRGKLNQHAVCFKACDEKHWEYVEDVILYKRMLKDIDASLQSAIDAR